MAPRGDPFWKPSFSASMLKTLGGLYIPERMKATEKCWKTISFLGQKAYLRGVGWSVLGRVATQKKRCQDGLINLPGFSIDFSTKKNEW